MLRMDILADELDAISAQPRYTHKFAGVANDYETSCYHALSAKDHKKGGAKHEAKTLYINSYAVDNGCWKGHILGIDKCIHCHSIDLKYCPEWQKESRK